MKRFLYYPFGMMMPGRKYAAENGYRYGFNGKENDNEVKGEGNQQDYGMRISDPRLGRFLSVDPITDEYPELTPYQFSSNTPISTIDLDGLESVYKLPDGSYYRDPYGPSDRLRPPPPPPGAQLMGVGPPMSKEDFSLAMDLMPVIGQIKAIDEAIEGEDAVTHRKLSVKERLVGLVPYAGKSKKISTALKAVNAGKKVTKTQQKIIKASAVVERLRQKAAATNKKKGTKAEEPILVTADGVAIPKGDKYKIPDTYVENPHRKGSYGTIDANGKFEEKLRIDPPTPPGQKGPNESHYHKDKKSTHYSPNGKDKDPGFQ